MSSNEPATGDDELPALSLMLDLIGAPLRAELLAVSARVAADPKFRQHIEAEMTRAVNKTAENLDRSVASIRATGDPADEMAAQRGAVRIKTYTWTAGKLVGESEWVQH